MTVLLRGITWDHARGYAPLAENTEAFSREFPGIRVEWSRRSLRDFGVQPVEDLARDYDLLVIDHPFTGRARTLGCLKDLRPLLPEDFLALMERQSVGPSTRSYDLGGLFAMPTDAACQVACCRPDFVERLDSEVPRTFDEVLSLGAKARSAGKWLAMPSCQSDSACLVATMAANLGYPIKAGADALVERPVFREVLDYLRALADLSIPQSRDWNPIATFDAMSAGDEIVYVPFAFGYSNYARKGAEPRLKFANIAGPGPDPAAGAILGGAGMAISANSRHVDEAVTYLKWVHRPSHQSTAYFEAGGQPGLRDAWTDPSVNELGGNFFLDTLETIEKAYLRPRFDGFIPAFEHMGLLVHRWLKDGGDRDALISEANTTFAKACENAAQLH